MTQPISVPSEAFDFTPPDAWRIYWEEYPRGTEMPATVPKKLWDAHWRRRNPDLAEKEMPPAPPAFWKCYWGKFRGRALSDRKRKRADDEGDSEGLPPVWPPQLSKRFWERYFEVFPDGHPAPEQGPYRPFVPGEQEPEKYKLVSGSLHVNVSGNPKCPIWRPSTGVDAWDKDGAWLGPG